MPDYHFTHPILFAVVSIPLWLAAWLWIRIGSSVNICSNGVWVYWGQFGEASFWWDPRWWAVHKWPGDVQVGPLQVVWL